MIASGVPVRERRQEWHSPDWQPQTGVVMPYEVHTLTMRQFPATVGGRWRMVTTHDVEPIPSPAPAAPVVLAQSRPVSVVPPPTRTTAPVVSSASPVVSAARAGEVDRPVGDGCAVSDAVA